MYALLLAAALATPQAETSTILKAIDNICGDTWCEGEFRFRFKKVTLNPAKNTTRVLFTMTQDNSLELDGGASIVDQKFNVSCDVAGYSTFAAIMENNDQLNWDFYTSLTDCIQKLEDRLNRVSRAN